MKSASTAGRWISFHLSKAKISSAPADFIAPHACISSPKVYIISRRLYFPFVVYKQKKRTFFSPFSFFVKNFFTKFDIYCIIGKNLFQ